MNRYIISENAPLTSILLNSGVCLDDLNLNGPMKQYKQHLVGPVLSFPLHSCPLKTQSLNCKTDKSYVLRYIKKTVCSQQ